VKKIVGAFAERIATLSSGLFTGASVYINLVEHPARMQAGTQVALAEFAPSYTIGRRLRKSLWQAQASWAHW
jgi:hypothetical protein